MRLNSVDLPAPFGPISACLCCFFTVRLTPRMIFVSPKDLCRFSSSSTPSVEVLSVAPVTLTRVEPDGLACVPKLIRLLLAACRGQQLDCWHHPRQRRSRVASRG